MKKHDKCSEITSVSKIKVEEGSRKATLVNEDGNEYMRTKIDGCAVQNVIAADWAIYQEKHGVIIIELKGKDVEHGVLQIKATARWLRNDYEYRGKLAALIVANQYPRFNTVVQRGQNAFLKEFKGPLHVVTKNYEYKIENIFDLNGPL